MFNKMDSHHDHSTYVTVGVGTNHNLQFYHLSDAIHLVRDFQCMDPRDKVYEILAVVQWAGSRKVSPDYRKERFDLAVEVLQALVEKIPNTSDTQYYDHWATDFVFSSLPQLRTRRPRQKYEGPDPTSTSRT